jgi:hypothetical protein
VVDVTNPTQKRKSRKDQRKIEREYGQQERLLALNQPTTQELKDKKDWKISATHNVTM